MSVLDRIVRTVRTNTFAQYRSDRRRALMARPNFHRSRIMSAVVRTGGDLTAILADGSLPADQTELVTITATTATTSTQTMRLLSHGRLVPPGE